MAEQAQDTSILALSQDADSPKHLVSSLDGQLISSGCELSTLHALLGLSRSAQLHVLVSRVLQIHSEQPYS